MRNARVNTSYTAPRSLSELPHDEVVKRLTRQAYRYQFGAEQDMNPAIAFLHNSYAVAYIDAVRDLAKDNEIQEAVGDEYWQLRKRVLAFQDKLQKQGEKAYELIKDKYPHVIQEVMK